MRATFTIAAASVAALLSVAGQAQAQLNRSFVSGHGDDSNPCSLTAPCRSFAQALTQTNAGGEIAVLDTAGYGAVTITKSVSIINEEGVEAGIAVATATDGIDINVGASDVVNLRGLTLTGGGVGQSGINFTNLGVLNIQNSVIRGFGNGIVFVPVGTAALNVSDTIVSNITQDGIAIQCGIGCGAGTVTAAINRVQAIDAGSAGYFINGANLTGAVNVTIANSAATNDGQGIVGTSTGGGAQTRVMVSNSVVSNNGTGVTDTGANSSTYLAKNTIAGNATALNVIASGQVLSFGDNYVRGNSDDSDSVTLSTTTTK